MSVAVFAEVEKAAPGGSFLSQGLVSFQHLQLSFLLVMNHCLRLQCTPTLIQDLNHHQWCSPPVHGCRLGLLVPNTCQLETQKLLTGLLRPEGTLALCKSTVVAVNQLVQPPSFQRYTSSRPTQYGRLRRKARSTRI